MQMENELKMKTEHIFIQTRIGEGEFVEHLDNDLTRRQN